MEKAAVQKKLVKSISEWSVFKIALITYLFVFILSVIFFAIVALITWAGFAASGIDLNNLFASTGLGALLSGFGIVLPNMNAVFQTGGVIGIVLFIVFGLLFSVVSAVIAVFWTWIFNVILKISGGFEVRYIDRNVVKVNDRASESTPAQQTQQ